MSTDMEQFSESLDAMADAMGAHQDSVQSCPLDPRLRHAVMNQVIPRLKALNRAIADVQSLHRKIGDPAFSNAERAAKPEITPRHLAKLIAILHDGTVQQRQQFFDGFVQQGATFDEICEGLIAPAARQLGACWSADTLSFSEVSAGCSGLQSDLVWLAERMRPQDLPITAAHHANSILLFAFPGDRHVLAASMLAESFRRAGWIVTLLYPTEIGDCLAAVQSHCYDIVATSLGRTELLPQLERALPEIRSSARNRNIQIMVGGPAIPDLAFAKALGADATSLTGQEAVFQGNMLVQAMIGRAQHRV